MTREIDAEKFEPELRAFLAALGARVAGVVVVFVETTPDGGAVTGLSACRRPDVAGGRLTLPVVRELARQTIADHQRELGEVRQ